MHRTMSLRQSPLLLLLVGLPVALFGCEEPGSPVESPTVPLDLGSESPAPSTQTQGETEGDGSPEATADPGIATPPPTGEAPTPAVTSPGGEPSPGGEATPPLFGDTQTPPAGGEATPLPPTAPGEGTPSAATPPGILGTPPAEVTPRPTAPEPTPPEPSLPEPTLPEPTWAPGGDADGDGIPNATEGGDDSDGDGVPNFQDDDSDGDGIPDATEGASDLDGDGIPNFQDDDSDGDGIPDAVEGGDDSDGDGVPNFQDDDSDGDGIPDATEGGGDSDGDGVPNFQDDDSDGDGIPDATEGASDLDGDGIPNFQDDDSDGDGRPDAVEGDGDWDGDGIPNFSDPDDCTGPDGSPDLDGDGYSICDGDCDDADAAVNPQAPEICGEALSLCWMDGAELLPAGTLYQDTDGHGDVYILYLQDTSLVDNTYGENSIGWSKGHSFGDLKGSDKARFAFVDGQGVTKLDVEIDYLNDDSSAPSGYSCPGVGGEGRVKSGDGSKLVSWDTTLAESLNDHGFCQDKRCTYHGIDLLVASPPASADYTPWDSTFEAWSFADGYRLRVSGALFGAAGPGQTKVIEVHNSPSKIENRVNPVVCP